MSSVFDQLNWTSDNSSELLQLVSTQLDTQEELRKRIRHHLERDYSAAALSWLPTVTWSAPTLVPLSSFDLRGIDKWPTWDDKEKIKTFSEKIQGGWHKAIVAIKVPGARYLLPIDGHTRLSVYWKLKRPVLAWVGKAHTLHGPWDTFHRQQRGMSANQKAAGFANSLETLLDGEITSEVYELILAGRREARETFPPGHPDRVNAERAVRQARKLRIIETTVTGDLDSDLDSVDDEVDQTQQEAQESLATAKVEQGILDEGSHSDLLAKRKQAQANFPPGHPERVKAEGAVRRSRAAAKAKLVGAGSTK